MIRNEGTRPLPELIISMIEGQREQSTIPCGDFIESFHSIEDLLGALCSKGWFSTSSVPHIFVVSSIHRSSQILKNHPVIIHDEGLVDLVVSAAEIIRHASNRPSASFVTYIFFTESLIANGAPEWAMAFARSLFPDSTLSHPMFSNPDPSVFQKFVSEDWATKKLFPTVLDATVRHQFNDVAEAVLFGHELGHYFQEHNQHTEILEKYGIGDEALEQLGILLDDQEKKEAIADIIGFGLAVRSLYGTWDYKRPGSMSWIAGLSILMLRINSVFGRQGYLLRRFLDGVDRDQVLQAVGHSYRAADVLTNPEILRRVFRWTGSKAKVMMPVISHFDRYATIVTSSIERSAATFFGNLYDIHDYCAANTAAWDRFTNRFTGGNGIADIERTKGYLNFCRCLLGDDIFRTLSVHSHHFPRAPYSSHISAHPSPYNREIKWHLGLPLKRSLGLRYERRIGGILIDVSNWKLEPA